MQFLKTKSKSTLTFIGLSLIVTVSALWLDDKESQPGSSPTTPEESNLPDYFMENYNIISTDIDGNANRWLSGKTLQHYPNGNTNLTQPTLQFSDNEQHWLLLANKGTIQEGSREERNEESEDAGQEGRKLALDGNVKIQQLNGKTKALIIETQHLDISTADNTASTQSEVKVSDENGEISATGMNINFNEHQLQLLSRVKGRYEFK